MENANTRSCENMLISIDTMLKFTQEFENIIANKLINQCEIISGNIANEDFNNNNISKYCEENGISEVYITDDDGVTIMTNNTPAMGFRFSEEGDGQAAAFRKILRDSSIVVTQNFQKRELDDKYYKYVAISRKDCKGIIQAGLNVEDILTLKI